MTKLFISHSSHDDAFVRALRAALADHGQEFRRVCSAHHSLATETYSVRRGMAPPRLLKRRIILHAQEQLADQFGDAIRVRVDVNRHRLKVSIPALE